MEGDLVLIYRTTTASTEIGTYNPMYYIRLQKLYETNKPNRRT